MGVKNNLTLQNLIDVCFLGQSTVIRLNAQITSLFESGFRLIRQQPEGQLNPPLQNDFGIFGSKAE